MKQLRKIFAKYWTDTVFFGGAVTFSVWMLATAPMPAAQEMKVASGGEFQPTAEQAKDLKIAKDAITIDGQNMQLIQDSMQRAITQYNQDVAAIHATAEKIKKENKWPDSVGFDVENVKFTAPPAVKGGPTTTKP